MRAVVRKLLHELDEAVFPSSIYCIGCGALIDHSRVYSLCNDCLGGFHWITGRTCNKCGKAMPDTSRGQLCYDCMQEEHVFRKGFSALTYGLHERELMMDLKYAGKGYLARIFGDILFDRLETEIREGLFAPPGAREHGAENARSGLFDDPLWEYDVEEDTTRGLPMQASREHDDVLPESDFGHVRIDVVAPVPVSPGRLRERGYNQSAIMARQLTARWKALTEEEIRGVSAGRRPPRHRTADELPAGEPGTGQPLGGQTLYPAPVCRSNLLYRTRETVKLRSLNPTERRMALQDAFAVQFSQRQRLAGKTVLLIDDIYTTGATADACSQALLEGGAKDVYLLTLASGGNRRPAE